MANLANLPCNIIFRKKEMKKKRKLNLSSFLLYFYLVIINPYILLNSPRLMFVPRVVNNQEWSSLQRSHKEFKHGPATAANQTCFCQPVLMGEGWRGVAVELAIANTIELAIRHKEKVLKSTPGSSANELGIIKPVEVWICGRRSPTKPVVCDAIQNTLWIKEKEFEVMPSTSSHQCGRFKPVK